MRLVRYMRYPSRNLRVPGTARIARLLSRKRSLPWGISPADMNGTRSMATQSEAISSQFP